MAKKDTVETKDETLEQRVAKLETSQNWVNATVRLVVKELKDHFNIGRDIAVAALFAVLSCSVMADDTVVDWGVSSMGTVGTAKITTDGTNATLTVDKTVTSGTSSLSNTTVTGTLTMAGAGNITNAVNVFATTKVTSYSRATVVSPSTTTYAIESGEITITNNVDAATRTYTQAFTSVYSAAPKVFLQYSVACPVAITQCVEQTVSPGTNFVVSGARTNVIWYSVGVR